MSRYIVYRLNGDAGRQHNQMNSAIVEASSTGDALAKVQAAASGGADYSDATQYAAKLVSDLGAITFIRGDALVSIPAPGA